MRFSGPVTALPCPVWRRSRPHLPARLFAKYKDALAPRRFSNNSLASFCSLPLSLTFLQRLLVPQAALSSTYSPARSLVPTEPIRRGQWEKMSLRDG
jgi:hypothetical protein